jgi:tetratricopeptide (TPR) repeat protein
MAQHIHRYRRPSIVTVLLLGTLLVAGGASLALATSYELAADTKAELDKLPDARTKAEFLEPLAATLDAEPAYHFELGNAYFDLSQFEKAEQHFTRATTLAPDYLAAYVNLGSVYDELGRLDDALTAYRAALKLNPDEEKTLCNIGGVFFQKRQIFQAMTSFQKAIDKHPDSQLAHYNMAILFADSKIYGEAIVEWQKVVDIDAASDLGGRSADNIEIIKQMQEVDLDGDHPGHDH